MEVLQPEGGRKRKFLTEWAVSARLPSSGRRLGVYQADDLIGADQVVPGGLVKNHRLGDTETSFKS